MTRRVFETVLVAAAFGVVVAIFKGQGDGVRAAIGNTSAPWLLLPFLATAILGVRRVVTGALVGLAVSMVALAGFYVAEAFVLNLGHHSVWDDIRLTFDGGRRYLRLGLLSGPVFGGFGSIWCQTRSRFVAAAVAALLVFEPAFVVVLDRLHSRDYSGVPAVWTGELMIGLAAVVLAIRYAGPRSRSRAR